MAPSDKIQRDIALLAQIPYREALHNRPSLAGVAGQLGVSSRTLQRRLWRRGFRFQDLLDHARCETAKQLLVDTDLPVQEISEQLRYGAATGFSRARRRWAGCTPSEFRKRERENPFLI